MRAHSSNDSDVSCSAFSVTDSAEAKLPHENGAGMDDPVKQEGGNSFQTPLDRRRRIARSILLLSLGSVLLIVFIIGVGDWRRQMRALDQCEWHASNLAARMGPGGALPMNLEPSPAPGRQSPMFQLEWTDRKSTRLLRETNDRYIVAQTVPVPQWLGTEGRAVVFYQAGELSVEWLTLTEFDKAVAARASELRRLAEKRDADNARAP